MPIHDWGRVEAAAVFHSFRHSWMSEIKRVLNGSLLTDDYYALTEMPEQSFCPEFAGPRLCPASVRHVSGDRVVAMVEVVSPGNKNTRSGLRSFVEKTAELLEKRVHLLILDLHPPGKRDPYGLHAALWEEVADEEVEVPPEKPLTLASYESSLRLRAFVEPVAVGEPLPDMPLFLEPEAYVLVPLEATYQRAFAAVPRRWQRVLEAPVS